MSYFLLLFLVLLFPLHAQSDRLLEAIRQIESSGDDFAVGDNGAAIGPYQIHYAYWLDAVSYDKKIGGSYQDCFDRAYAKKIVRAYMRRYAPKNASSETYARIHNGGPRGASVKATKSYWLKVKKLL